MLGVEDNPKSQAKEDKGEVFHNFIFYDDNNGKDVFLLSLVVGFMMVS